MRCVIVSAARINSYDTVKSYFKSDDYFIFCDAGLNHSEKLGVKPDLIVGDFDSHEKPETDVEIITLPTEKDDTDTVFAVKEAIKRGFDDFLLIGVIGERLDHTLGNVSILEYLANRNKTGLIVDDYSEMQLVSREEVEIDPSFSYFSLLSVFGEANGIFINNAKYPLNNAAITSDYQYGISNEVLPNQTAHVRVENGKLLLIKVR